VKEKELGFCHQFPAVRGFQANRSCYIAMCPMRIVSRLFSFDGEEVPAELRAQRKINLGRIPDISSYLVDNPKNYTLSSITASISGPVQFEPINKDDNSNLGILSISMDAQILINDGQHRRAAIEAAIKEMPKLGQDNISVLFFTDDGLKRSQQMFADLNKNAVRPSNSINTLYDHRDELSGLARHVQDKVKVFNRLTELEKSSISNRSSKLFTLSGIRNANKTLLSLTKHSKITTEHGKQAIDYWQEVSENIPDWQKALNNEVLSSELREQHVHAHAVLLQALGIVGQDLLQRKPKSRTTYLRKLQKIDWSRKNKVWEGRAMNQGRISKALVNQMLTANHIKSQLGLKLSPEENEAEKAYSS